MELPNKEDPYLCKNLTIVKTLEIGDGLIFIAFLKKNPFFNDDRKLWKSGMYIFYKKGTQINVKIITSFAIVMHTWILFY